MENKDKELWTYHQVHNKQGFAMCNPRQEMLYRKMKHFIAEKGKVLEIGFGNGALLSLLQEYFQAYGSDISEENIEKIKKENQKASFSLMDVDGKLPYPSNYFDGFVASEVLEHMSNEELKVCVDEMYRVLKSGGYAFITFPANEDLKRNECFCPHCKALFHKYGHKQSWNRKKVHSVFSRFSSIKVSEYYNPFVGVGTLERVFGKIMWITQTTLNTFTSFPDKIFHNKVFVVILEKK
jgi:ubiquinone/menaquinone biosynthesis C-methylase UbiE